MERAEGSGGGGGGGSLDAALVKEEPECATFTSHMTIKEEVRHVNEVRPKEEPECASSAGCASGTGAVACAGAAREVKVELELAPARVQHGPNMRGVSRPLESVGEAWPKRGCVSHRQPAGAGTPRAGHDTAQHNTISDTLQHTAQTHTYKCDTCGQIFLQKQYLIDHVQVHLREGSDTLPNESLFNLEPSDTGSSVKKYPCKICKKKFRKDYLKIHARYHTGEKPYACDLCVKSFARASNLKTHKLIHTGEKPYSCKICKKWFTQTSNLKKHVRIHSGEKPYGCTICKKLFTQWSDLETHKRMHAPANPYSCEICKMTFIQLDALKTHKLIHVEDQGARGELYAHVTKYELVLGPGHTQRPNTVHVLGEKSRSVVHEYGPALTAHREPADTPGAEHETAQQNLFTDTLHHTAETHAYRCDICGQIFLQKHCLINHERVHLRERSETLPNKSLFILEPSETSVKKYSCKICKKKFRKDYLKIHARLHTGQKPHACEVCKKQFTTLGSLRQHTRIHTEERPYACYVCGKSFVRLDHLEIHERSHTGEKPYKCETCKMRFSQLPNLQSHIRTHTGEKPYACTMCDKQFRQWSTLNNHKKSHKVEKSFSCETCKKTFRKKSSFEKHKHEAVSMKQKSDSSASDTHKETRVKEEPKCESSADSCGVSETGATVDYVIKAELELGPEGVQRRDIPIAPREKSRLLGREYGPALDRCAVTAHRHRHRHRQPAGTTAAQHETAIHNTITETLKHTAEAETHSYVCNSCGETFLQKQCLIDHVKVHLREESDTLPNESSILELGDTDTSVKKYSCKICKKKYRKNYLKIHESCHTGEKPHACGVCNKQFATLGSLREHKRTHTEAKPYSCDLCTKKFARVDQLKIHGRSHTGEKPYKCETCKKGFSQVGTLQSHIRTHTKERPYTCTMCDKRFTQWSSLNKHKRSHTNEKSFSCETCKKTFRKKSSFEKHKHEAVSMKEKSDSSASETHKETRVKEEPKCESSADSCGVSETGATVDYVIKAELELGPEGVQRRDIPNIPIAPREKSRFAVRVYGPAPGRCGATTRAPAAPHVIAQHTAETHTYRCDTCGHIFLQNQCLIDHVKVHLRERSETLPDESLFNLQPSDTSKSVKKYSCTICKKKFRKDYLKIHARLHTGQKPYACEVCKKQFASPGNLKDHKRVHTGERPHSCDVCEKSFARLDHLKIHERIHTGKKPYKCEICNKGFSQLTNLQSHIRTHTGENPYACTMCDKQFRQWSSLNKHKRSHTVENPYSCEISKNKFQQPGALNVHEISHTNEKPFSCELKNESVSVKEKSECESSTDLCGASETHKETGVTEKCESSADSYRVSERGASVNHLIKVELELEREQRCDTPIAPRSASPRCELLATTSGASGAQQPANTQETSTTHDALQATANHLTSDKQTASKRPYICDICNKTFTQSGSLNTHKRIHTGEKPYSCEVCNKTFTALATFNNHKITAHTHLKPHTCEICNKSFKLLASLKTHGRIHTESKRYSCDICKRQFRYISALRVHNRIHMGVKPYACDICKQQFSKKSSVDTHIIHMHTREKPFCCEICKRQFATKGNLNYHVGTHAKHKS